MANYIDATAQESYSLWIKNSSGQLVAVLGGFNYLYCARSVNTLGTLIFEIEEGLLPDSLLARDSIVEIYAKLPSVRPVLLLESQWRLVKTEFNFIRGVKVIRVYCHDALFLLNQTRVAYRSGLAQTEKSGQPSALSTAVITENLGSSANDAARFRSNAIDSSLFSVQPSKAGGPTITPRSLIGKRVLTALQQIADQSAQAGTIFFFDVVLLEGNKLEFRTYLNYRGNDHSFDSGAEIVLSEKNGTLTDVAIVQDYTNVYDVAYAGGAGQGADRLISTAVNTETIGSSPFGAAETWIEARQQKTQSTLDNFATQALKGGAARRVVSGSLVSGALRFGIDFGYGDRVTVGIDNQVYTARFDGISIEIKEGYVKKQAFLRVE